MELNNESILIKCEFVGSSVNRAGIKTIKFDLPFQEFPQYIKLGLSIGRECEVILKQEDTTIDLGKVSFNGLNIKNAGNAQLKLCGEKTPLDCLDKLNDDEIVKLKVTIIEENND